MPRFEGAAPSATAIEKDPGRPGELDRLVVLAGTFRDLATPEREARAVDLAGLTDGFAERLLLHTCHRVELVGVVEDGMPSPNDVRMLCGAEAVERVFTVTAGFDSAVIAEEQLLGQVRDAYETALTRGETGPILNELLRRAIRFGKRVRSEAQPGADRSLADRAAAWALTRLDEPPGRVLIVGSGEMGRLLAARFAAAGLVCTVASRNADRARRISDAVQGARHAELRDALADAGRFSIIAIALRSSPNLLTVEHVGDALPLVIDLSSPGAVTPDAAARLGDRLLDLDRLGRAKAVSALTPASEQRLRQELISERDRFIAWLDARGSADGIALLREHAEQLRRTHLDRLRRRGKLSDEQLRAVDAMTASLLADLLHVPTLQLRRGKDAAERVRELFGFGT